MQMVMVFRGEFVSPASIFEHYFEDSAFSDKFLYRSEDRGVIGWIAGFSKTALERLYGPGVILALPHESKQSVGDPWSAAHAVNLN